MSLVVNQVYNNIQSMIAAIKFYRAGQNYGFLSNFYKASFENQGKEFPTSQHFFQAMKFSHDPQNFQKVRAAKSAREAADLGRSLPVNKQEWHARRIEVMRIGLKNKFGQNKKLKKQLLETGQAELIQHTQKDSFWGDGGNGSGQNMLGKLLMEVREQFKRTD